LSNDVEKEQSFCTHYNIINDSDLSIENSKNKFINITTVFPNNRYKCFTNEMEHSLDFASQAQINENSS